jgi:hydroxymethylbilane synthase
MSWVIGTRGSALARWQADHVQTLIQTHVPNQATHIRTIQTTGDQDQTSPLHAIGGKGVFTKTIEEALLDGHIDMAVHSLKDMTSAMPEALQLTAFLAAESPADAWISAEHPDFNQLPETGTIATGSLRRAALVKRQYPMATIVPIRGNVDTRLTRYSQIAIGTFLSVAGLERLGLRNANTHALPVHTFTPAPGQGVIVVQTRRTDTALNTALSAINHPHQERLARLELDFLHHVGLDCRAPLGVHAWVDNNHDNLSVFLSTNNLSCFMDETYNAIQPSDIKTLADRCLIWLDTNQ